MWSSISASFKSATTEKRSESEKFYYRDDYEFLIFP